MYVRVDGVGSGDLQFTAESSYFLVIDFGECGLGEGSTGTVGVSLSLASGLLN